MMRKTLAIVLLGALALGSSGCVVRQVELGGTRNETRDLESFDQIELAGYGNLTVVQGAGYEIELSGADSVLDRLSTEVRGDTLYIEQDDPWFRWWTFSEPGLDLVVTVPELTRIAVAGAGEVTMDDFEGEEFEFRLSGAGSFSADDVRFEDLRVTLSGAGSAELSGEVDSQRVEISGAGSYDGKDLRSSSARVEMSGAGNAVVWVEDDLDLDLSGAGSVEYYGDPRVSQDLSGLGSVQRRGDR